MVRALLSYNKSPTRIIHFSEASMLDLIFLATTVVLFVVCATYLVACESL